MTGPIEDTPNANRVETDIWSYTHLLRRNRDVGIELVTYCTLLEIFGIGVHEGVCITAERIKEKFHRDPSTIRAHLEKLHAIGIVVVRTRDRRNGIFVLDILRPAPDHATRRPDPQLQLPLEWTAGRVDLRASMAKQQSGDNAGDGHALRGDAPAGVAADDARELPRDVPGEIRGDFPVAFTSGENAPIPPTFEGPGKSPGDSREVPGRFQGSPREIPGKSPSLKTNEDRISPSNGLRKPRNSTLTPRANCSARSHQDQSEVGQAAFADLAVQAAVAHHFSPAEQKERLVLRIRSLVRDEETARWLYGFSADVMLCQGFGERDDAGSLYAAMEDLLQRMAAFREGEQRNGKPPQPLGRWLNSAVHKIARAHGIEPPCDKKAARST